MSVQTEMEEWCGEGFGIDRDDDQGWNESRFTCHELDSEGRREKFTTGDTTYLSVRRKDHDRLKISSDYETEVDAEKHDIQMDFGPWHVEIT